jgi:hypothetical protein
LKKPKVLKSPYTSQQLKEWHDRLAERVFQIPEVILTDINDETNRLTVGIKNLGIRGQVEEQLEALDIPREAVEIEEIEPFELLPYVGATYTPTPST